MTDREKFEAWNSLHGRYRRKADAYEIVGGRYWIDTVQISWEVWQASRKQMAEEAAAVCAELIPSGCSTNIADVSRNQGIRACADAVRALGGVEPTLDTPRAVTAEEDSILRAAILGGSTLVAKGRSCHCQACDPQGNGFDTPMRMILCATCGNKRCPHATDHRNACTNSNEPGQKGSSWEGVRSLATPTEGKT